jgi:hypothetical protein
LAVPRGSHSGLSVISTNSTARATVTAWVSTSQDRWSKDGLDMGVSGALDAVGAWGPFAGPPA